MASVNIYDQGNDTTYKVSFDIKSSTLAGVEVTGETDFFIDVYTNMKKVDGTAFPHFLVRTLDDIPPGYAGTATDFTNLCGKYITYFIDEAELIASSSSSSQSESSSSGSV